ncbi:lipoprotein [Streptomyces viridochromogenes]|uniref:Putative Lipoprotein n=1 Tax=Streptomyces viridochromogenes Tue57 TaxID=1160705 RepID=L8P2P1_STRVR|nr:lipoprotein [Streptomyces viridochromogenes]ELS50434.1 putative Lipoprotein [Streptomyces viridochromogenes Tue57]
MLVGAGQVRRGLAQAAVLAGLLTGCAGAAEDDPKTSARASASADAAEAGDTAVKSGGTIGAAGSACELPVSFDIAEYWEAEAVDAGAAKEKAADSSADSEESEFAQEFADAFLRQGPVTAACEVDAKPAGNIGFLRIWTGEPGDDDARAVLEAFVAAEGGTSKAKYRTFEAGGLSGVEVEYLYTSKLLEETKEESALAVATKRGPVVIHLGGFDTDEHRDMLPAYELAKRTLRAT